MLNDEQAGEIVINCIKAISGVTRVNTTKSLRQAQLIDSERVLNMVTLIVNSERIGVLSRLHRIDSRWFQGVDPDTIVNDVAEIVRSKSSRIHADVMEDLASLLATKLAVRLTPPIESTSTQSSPDNISKTRKTDK